MTVVRYTQLFCLMKRNETDLNMGRYNEHWSPQGHEQIRQDDVAHGKLIERLIPVSYGKFEPPRHECVEITRRTRRRHWHVFYPHPT